MPTFELTVHTLRLLLAHEDVDAAFEELNCDYLHQLQQEQNLNERCSIQCEVVLAGQNLDGQIPAPESEEQCEEQTSPRSSVDGVRAASP